MNRRLARTLAKFIREGTKAWADVPDAAQWVREIRGRTMKKPVVKKSLNTRSIEYHLQWRLNSETWYFAECYHTLTGALLKLQAARKLARKNTPGQRPEWRLIEQEKFTRLVVENV